MTQRRRRDEWLQDLQDRQRNVVFPATVQNEARFWRNLQNSPWKTSTKFGVAILAIFVAAWLTRLLLATLQQHVLWALVLVMQL